MEFEELQEQEEQDRKAVKELAGQDKQSDGMTLRERFLRTMHYQEVDKIPNFEFGYWKMTLIKWREQGGLPEWVVNEKTAYEYFGIENYYTAPVNPRLRGICEWQILEETETTKTFIDNMGVKQQNVAEGDMSIPHYLDYPVKDRDTWLPYKEELQNLEGRYADDWDELVEAYKDRDYPLGIGIGSLIGLARNLIGFENTALMVYTDPELMEEIVEDFTVCIEKTIAPALKQVRFDFAAGWEDIAFNSGPIVGVDFFENVLKPRYKRITDLLRLHGVNIVQTDCDGNISTIVPSFLAGGVNTMFPVEIHGGTDPVALRKQHGKEIRFWGGVDKMIFLKDKAAVDKELERIRPVIEEGGMIPTVDHRVQSDADLDLYKHYLDRKREWFNCGGPEPKY